MPDPTLQAVALRYAANDLPPDEAATFEARLATDETAQDALSEAVRLSARALGQEPPAPRRPFADRPRPRRRGYAAAGLVAAAGVLAALHFSKPAPQFEAAEPPAAAPHEAHAPAVAPEPRAATDDDEHRTTAEIWAELSTPDHVEKAHDDELKRRQWMREVRNPAGVADTREP